MFCCSNCFADAEIKAIIDGNKTTGNCDFCGSHDAHVYDIGKDHSNYINTDMLFTFLRCAVKSHRKGEVMYRSRICPDEKGFKKIEMGPPPDNRAKGGRVNPTGIITCYSNSSHQNNGCYFYTIFTKKEEVECNQPPAFF